MKKIKFKNNKTQKQKYLFISIFICLITTYFLTSVFIGTLSSHLSDYLSALVRKQNIIVLKEAFAEVKLDDVAIESLLTVIKNSKEEITEVEFDIKASTKLLAQITSSLNKKIDNYNYYGYRLDIPIGFLTQNPILINVGPKIPIKVELSDVALGNVRTSVKSFGINSALIEVYLDISLNSSIIYPFEVIAADSKYSSLIASKIISGTVPNFFGGAFASQSDTINIPLTEKNTTP